MTAAATVETAPETAVTTVPFIAGWSSHPIPDFSLSAAGLLVLADLSTLAQRTALHGGSSWLDSLLLVPGLHYQQAADNLARGAEGAAVLTAVEIGLDGKPLTHRIVNQAVVNYVLRTAKEGETVVLDVGDTPVRSSRGAPRAGAGRASGQRAILYGGGGGSREKRGQEKEKEDDDGGLSGAANLLYLASPVLTCVAITFIVLLRDWWALALILGLMISRILNISVIKSRSRPKPPVLPAPFTPPPAASLTPPPRITSYTITLGPATIVILRGLSTDLYALTTTVWLRPKTHVEGYLEATAKVLVYLVAAVSGNASQAGNIVLLALLLVSAGLLALSNARTTGLRNGGKLVAPSYPYWRADGGHRGGGAAGGRGPGRRPERQHQHQHQHQHQQHGRSVRRNSLPREVEREGWPSSERESWPSSSGMTSLTGMEDSLEKGQAGHHMARDSYASDSSFEYSHAPPRAHTGTVQAAALGNRPEERVRVRHAR